MKSLELKQQIKAKELSIAEKREKLDGFAKILETRDLDGEENKSLEALTGEVTQAKADIADLQARVNKLESIEEDEAEVEDEGDGNRSRNVPAVVTRSRLSLDSIKDVSSPYATREYQAAWLNHLQTGESIRTNAASFLSGTPAAGGYAIAPVSVSNKIVTLINNQTPLRNKITRFPLKNAVAFRVPKLTTNPATPAFGTEGQCLSPDLTAAFGNIDLTPQLAAQMETLSLSMLNLGGPAIVDFVTNRLAYLFAIFEESQILTGNGTGTNFTGAFTASANGIPTSQDVATATAGTLAGDDFINTYASLQPSVFTSPNTAWVMHPTTWAVVRKLKDSTGRYLYDGLNSGLVNGNQLSLLGIPVILSMYAPAFSTTSGSYVAVVGDWSYYYESEYEDAFTIQRLNERFADCSLVAIMGRRWLAGAPVLSSAFGRIKIT